MSGCWFFMAAIACEALPLRSPSGKLRSSFHIQRSTELRDHNFTNSWLEQPLETVLNTSEAISAKVQKAGRTISKVASVTAEEVGQGHFLGAVSAAGETLAMELDAEEDSGRSARSFGYFLVLLVPIICWISELCLAKLWDPRAQSTNQEAVVPESKLFFHAISFARYLMAWHVVLSHFAFGGDTDQEQTSTVGEPWAAFCRWGAIAAPWFYMASGFTNSYSKLISPPEQRNKEEDSIHAMVKRVLSWYPFYLIALIWCAARVATVEAEDWAYFMAHGMAVHGLVWGEKESFPFLTGDVWLSWLVVYLLTWAPVHAAIAETSEYQKDSIIWTIFTTSFLITIPSVLLEWIWFGNMAPFLVIQLWPSFLFGQALAFWFVKHCMEERDVQVGASAVVTKPVWVRKNVTEIPVPVRFGVTISFLVLGVIFFSLSPHDTTPLIQTPVLAWFQKGFQLPVQGLMIVGLAAEIDPISKLFARRPFREAEQLSLMMFIFQVPIYNTVKDLTGQTGMSILFIISLVGFTVITHYLLERPYRQWRRLRERGESWKEEPDNMKLQK